MAVRDFVVSLSARVVVGRYYDPSTGQFLTVDPLAAQTGAPYAYAWDDPPNVVDRLGLAAQCVGAAAANPTRPIYVDAAVLQSAPAAGVVSAPGLAPPWPIELEPGTQNNALGKHAADGPSFSVLPGPIGFDESDADLPLAVTSVSIFCSDCSEIRGAVTFTGSISRTYPINRQGENASYFELPRIAVPAGVFAGELWARATLWIEASNSEGETTWYGVSWFRGAAPPDQGLAL